MILRDFVFLHLTILVLTLYDFETNGGNCPAGKMIEDFYGELVLKKVYGR